MTAHERLQQAVDDGVKRIGREIEGTVRSMLDGVLKTVQADRESAIQAARAAADADAALARSAELSKIRDEERQTTSAVMDRLLQGVREIESGQTLTEVLDALMTTVSSLASRAALLVVQGDRVRGWRLVGYEPAPSLDLHASDAGVVGRVVETGETCQAENRQSGDAPGADRWFGPLAANRRGVAVPVRVGGQVAAVAYADGAADGTGLRRFEPAAIEVLVRHAGRCLEALTVLRASQTTGAGG